MKKSGVVGVLVISLLIISLSFGIVSASWFGDFWGKITGNAVAKTYDCKASIGKTTFTGFHNTAGLNNGDLRFICYNQRFYECGWELNNDKFAKKMKNGDTIGNWQCDLSNKKLLLKLPNCEKASGATVYTGKDGQIGLNNGDTRFLCLSNTFYECGWELSNPNFAVKAADGRVVGGYRCNLNSKSWAKKDVVCEKDSDCGVDAIQTSFSGVLNRNVTLCKNSIKYSCVNPQTNISSCSKLENNSCSIRQDKKLAILDSRIYSCGSENVDSFNIFEINEDKKILRNADSAVYCDISSNSWKDVIFINKCIVLSEPGIYELRDNLYSQELICLKILNSGQKDIILDGRGYNLIQTYTSTLSRGTAIKVSSDSTALTTFSPGQVVVKNFKEISNFDYGISFNNIPLIILNNTINKNVNRGISGDAINYYFEIRNNKITSNDIGIQLLTNNISGSLIGNIIQNNRIGLWYGPNNLDLKNNIFKSNGQNTFVTRW